MLNRISEIGIHISIPNLLRKERVNDISRYEVAVSTLGTSLSTCSLKSDFWEESDQVVLKRSNWPPWYTDIGYRFN